MVAITTVKTFSFNLLIVVNLSLLLFIIIFGVYTNGALFQMSHIPLPFTETKMRELEHVDLSPKSETTALNSKASKIPRNREADIPKTKRNKPNEPKYSEVERQSNTGGAKRDDATVENHNMSARVIELAKMLKERLEHPKDRHPRKIKHPCEDIDYSKNSYVQRKPCFGAKCDKKFNRSFKDRVKDVLLSPQYQLSRTQLDAILSLSKNVPETDVIIVSAVSSNHYDEMQMMFKNLHETVYPTLRNFRVVLFDIGLSPKERQQTEKSCQCQVVTFTFDLFPSHVLDRHCYAWKPLIVRSLMDKARQLLIWQDASVRWRSRYMEMFDRARILGLQVLLGGGDRVTANTLHETFEYMGETECLFEFVPEIANAVAVYKADVFNKLAVLTPWARCALESTCMCPQDPNIVRYCGQMKPLRCHRFDQSALTLLLGKLFYDERYRFEIQQPHNIDFVELQRKTVAPNYFQEISTR